MSLSVDIFLTMKNIMHFDRPIRALPGEGESHDIQDASTTATSTSPFSLVLCFMCQVSQLMPNVETPTRFSANVKYERRSQCLKVTTHLLTSEEQPHKFHVALAEGTTLS